KGERHSALPVFGIKAKQVCLEQFMRSNSALPVFGIKAKPNQYALNHFQNRLIPRLRPRWRLANPLNPIEQADGVLAMITIFLTQLIQQLNLAFGTTPPDTDDATAPVVPLDLYFSSSLPPISGNIFP
ncbi:MAG TPA: hypothetical protein VHH88_12560, partial [Verrucomicrobiae bacterium]|nr:hypothetical protein [Verrucomicrobiae bacterium]